VQCADRRATELSHGYRSDPGASSMQQESTCSLKPVSLFSVHNNPTHGCLYPTSWRSSIKRPHETWLLLRTIADQEEDADVVDLNGVPSMQNIPGSSGFPG
jgi:hypothetical protein